MAKASTPLKNFATHSLFGAFCLTMFGWGLLHIWCGHVHATLLLHALCAVPGAVLVGVIIYRYRQHWPIANESMHKITEQGAVPFGNWHDLSSYLLFIVVGGGVGVAVRTGSVLITTVAALSMVLAPWAKLSGCVRHFYVSSAVLVLGAVLSIVLMPRAPHPLYLLLAAWAHLSVACITVLFAIYLHGNRRERMSVTPRPQPPPLPQQ